MGCFKINKSIVIVLVIWTYASVPLFSMRLWNKWPTWNCNTFPGIIINSYDEMFKFLTDHDLVMCHAIMECINHSLDHNYINKCGFIYYSFIEISKVGGYDWCILSNDVRSGDRKGYPISPLRLNDMLIIQVVKHLKSEMSRDYLAEITFDWCLHLKFPNRWNDIIDFSANHFGYSLLNNL